MKLAVLQLASRVGDVDANLNHLEDVVTDLPGDCDLAVAPELYVTGYDLDLIQARSADLAETIEGPTVRRLVDLAADSGMVLVVGFLERDGDEVYDSVVVINPEDAPVVYRKTHLYPAEQPVFDRGDALITTDVDQARLGMMICFEHAFPEIATALALEGSNILLIPSAVPVGYEHVLALRTRARAQDNQVFAVGCNMANPFCGLSLIVDPRGEVVASASGADEEVLVATLDLGEIVAEREREPSLGLRRPDLYH